MTQKQVGKPVSNSSPSEVQPFHPFCTDSHHLSSGVFVNGQIIGDKKIPPDGKINTYFWRFGIVHRTLGVSLQVTTQYISVSQDGKDAKLLWTDTASLKGPK